MTPKNLKSYFPNYLENGAFFSKMSKAPWVSVSPGIEIDVAYLSWWSGVKPASMVLDDFSNNGVANGEKIADMLWYIFGRAWTKLWESFVSEYSPINNYNIDETIERELGDNRSVDKTIDATGTVNKTENGTTTTSDESTLLTLTSGSENGTTKGTDNSTTTYGKVVKSTSQDDAYTYAFNSTDKVPTSVSIGTTSETQSGSDTIKNDSTGNSDTTTSGKVDTTTTDSGTLTNAAIIGETTTDKTKDVTKDNRTENETITRSRKGMSGQFSYQELLQKEFDLWKWNFYKQLFKDCDSILTLSVYNYCGDYISSVD